MKTHFRTHHCGALTLKEVGQEVVLCGWVQKIRNLGGMTFIDLRDRYGITQLVFNSEKNHDLQEQAAKLGREYVIQVRGRVVERESKNPHLATGEIEIEVNDLILLNTSVVPPFTIEAETDGGEELRMKFRYLDLRRSPLKENMILRHRLALATRTYLDSLGFLEIETPFLIKSTPEGARDFVVPSRLHPGQFYALPQSPQTFKQLLMVAGYDRYFQIVRCFRDEDLRADRQPEFTQIDCEMAFVNRQDVMQTFEGLIRYLFKAIKNIDIPPFKVISYDEAMNRYGSDKPDLRFDMPITDISAEAKGKGFGVFDSAEMVAGICVKGGAHYTRKQLDILTEFVKKPQIGARGLTYVKWEPGGCKSSVDKFYASDDLMRWAHKMNASEGDLLLILCGEKEKVLRQLGSLRLKVAEEQKLVPQETFACLWVVDFPLFEYDQEEKRWVSVHHPFTSPKSEDILLLDEDPGKVRAEAYDMVINGVEVGGGSVRIYNKSLQQKVFQILGLSQEESMEKFGFLLNAFQYGAPPHGGIAFGFDRLCAVFAQQDSIRDFIAFPKNNAGKDVMIDAPSPLDEKQLKELYISLLSTEKSNPS